MLYWILTERLVSWLGLQCCVLVDWHSGYWKHPVSEVHAAGVWASKLVLAQQSSQADGRFCCAALKICSSTSTLGGHPLWERSICVGAGSFCDFNSRIGESFPFCCNLAEYVAQLFEIVCLMIAKPTLFFIECGHYM